MLNSSDRTTLTLVFVLTFSFTIHVHYCTENLATYFVFVRVRSYVPAKIYDQVLQGGAALMSLSVNLCVDVVWGLGCHSPPAKKPALGFLCI